MTMLSRAGASAAGYRLIQLHHLLPPAFRDAPHPALIDYARILGTTAIDAGAESGGRYETIQPHYFFSRLANFSLNLATFGATT